MSGVLTNPWCFTVWRMIWIFIEIVIGYSCYPKMIALVVIDLGSLH
jgi:hypothetical protein